MTRLVSVAAALLVGIAVFVPSAVPASEGIRLQDVADSSGLDFRHGAFRFGTSADPVAMMGSGLCWLDYDRDGWLDLFVVNSYAERDTSRWQQRGGLPRSALFRNVKGKFVDVSSRSGANLAVRGMGCVAADLDQDGDSDLYVTAAGASALLWNEGNGRFREGAAAAGVAASGWRSSAAVGDVNGDRRPDLFVGGYTDLNAPIAGSGAGFPSNHAGVRDLLYLNLGLGRFREVGRQAGLESARFDHTLGAVFSDLDRDGRLDLYVANGDFDDDNMVGTTAFMETLELAVELRRAGYGENGERLGFDLYPYTEDAVAAVERSVLQWRFIDSVAARIDDAALREAQAAKDAVRAYELVYAALGA